MADKKKTKTLCGWSSDAIVDDIATLAEIVESPRFVCRRCARAAGKKKWLCKPTRLPKT